MKKRFLQLMLITVMLVTNTMGQTYQWAKKVPLGPRAGIINDMVIDRFGNIYMAQGVQALAGSYGNYAKFDSAGVLIYTRSFPAYGSSTSFIIRALGLDYAGNIYAATSGDINSAACPNASTDPTLVKADSAGNLIWCSTINTSEMAVDSAGNVFAAEGNTVKRINTNGTLVWSTSFYAKKIAVNGNHLYACNDTLIVRLSKSNGSTLATYNVSSCLSIDVLNNGVLYYTGNNGTGKLTNLVLNWFLPGVTGNTISINSSGAWVSADSTLKFINPSGSMVESEDSLSYTIRFIVANASNKLYAASNFLVCEDEMYCSPAFLKPYFIYNNDPFGLGYLLGCFSRNDQILLAYSRPFWDDYYNNFNGHWLGDRKCPGGSTFDMGFRLYDTTFSSGNIVFAELSDAFGSFQNPIVIGAVSTTSDTGTIICQLPTGLTNSTGYKVRLRSTLPALNGVQNSSELTIESPAPANVVIGGTSTTFCLRTDTLRLSPSGFGQWQRNGSSISGAMASSFLPVSSGTYRCILTDSYGCTRLTTNQLSVNILPLPSVSITPTGSREICSGDSLQISVPAVAGNSYQWLKANNTILTGQTSAVYQAKTAGNYKVRVTGSNGCTRLSSTVKVTVYKPVIQAFGPTTFCAGGSVVLGAQNSSSTTTWQWTRNNILIAGAGSQFYTATQQGTYRVIGTRTSGCTATSSSIAVTVNCREGENYVQESFAIFPNPANEQATVVFEGRDDGDILLTCTDLMGRQVQQITVNASEGQQQININTGALEPGVYIISLIYPDSNVRTARLIVSR